MTDPVTDLATDVIVVGAGPVGLMLAGELRLGGAGVVVVDRLTEPTSESRASTLHARTMELLDQRGLLDELGDPPRDGMGHFGGIPLPLDGLPSSHPGQWKVPQDRTERLLAAWATGLGARLLRGRELTGLSAGERGVRAELRGPDGASVMTAGYLVGCDGEDSTVRRLTGVGFPGTDANRELLRADVLGIDIPNRRFQRLPAGLAIAARRPDGLTRVMVHEFDSRAVPGRAAPSFETPSFEDVVKAWARVTGEDIGHGEPVWVNSFGNTSRQASRYRVGRVLLAGDAAHVQMPVGGQALNLGLQDAVNLGWKLAAQVRGQAGPHLLDTYHDERHAVGADVLTDITAQSLILLGGPEVDPMRSVMAGLLGVDGVRERLAAGITGLGIRYPVDGGHPLLGSRLPPTELATESGPVHTAVALRAGRGLLLDLAGRLEVPPPWADRVRTIRAPAPEGSALAGFGAVLVRPDGYVAWADRAATGLREALIHWFGHPNKETDS